MSVRKLFSFISISILLSACTSENETVLKAVQKYRLRGQPIAEILNARVDTLRDQGIDAEYQWIAPRFEQDNFEVKAVIRVQSKNFEEPYTWSLTEQPTSSNAKSKVWSVKATSSAAKAVVRGDKWAGVGILATR